MHLQVFGGNEIRIGDHGFLTLADGDLTVVDPGFAGGIGCRQRLELLLDLDQRGLGQSLVRGDEADAGADVVFGLGQQVRGDHFGIASGIGHDENL